jgi:hypothetical protein
VFYSSNQNVPDYDIFAVMSTGIYPIHDVTVSRLSASNNLGTFWEYSGGLKSIGQNAIETVTVSIANIGDYVENVNVTLIATNTTLIRIGTLHSLVGPSNTMNFYFYWNTTGVRAARYGFSVSLAGVAYTFGNTGDNSYSLTNKVWILPVGDVDQDGWITIQDLSVANLGYGATPGNPRWNAFANITGSGTISIVDINYVAYHYGTVS